MDDMTRFEARFEERLRAFARTGVQSVDSAAVARAVAAGHPKSAATRLAVRPLGGEFGRTRQRAVLGSWRTRSMFKPSLAVAAVVAVLLAGALLTTRRDQPLIGNPSPSVPAVAVPSATPTAEASPSPDSTSVKLTWVKVALDKPFGRTRTSDIAWVIDRFVMVDDTGAVSTSTDGLSWQALQPGDPDPGYVELLRGRGERGGKNIVTWGDDIVGWWNNPKNEPDVTNKAPVAARDVLRIVRPPAEPTETTPWNGSIDTMAIGPAGIVAQVASHLDWDAWVASKLGDDWGSRYKGVDFKDGILEITMKRGRGLKVVWADQGFEPGDYLYTGFGWYSPDGEHWTLMPAEAPTPNGNDVVGVSDGFIARGNEAMWHSSDGLTWRNLGRVNAEPSSDVSVLVPWQGGALFTNGVERFDFWTSQGPTQLPMAAELPATWKQGNLFGASPATGPLGLLAVQKGDHHELLFTRDGVAWDIQAMPAEMESAHTSGSGWSDAVVGDRSVLVVLRSGTDEAPIRTLWLGTPEP